MPWLNILKPIVERDVTRIETVIVIPNTGVGGTATIYALRRTTRWVTTRYVGGSYAAACALRDSILTGDPDNNEAEIVAAGAGQYQVVATVRTLGSWTHEG